MSHNRLKRISAAVLTVVFLGALTGTAGAVEYYLRAETFTKNLPHPTGVGTVAVTMWGFALDDSFGGLELQAVSVPGPRLTVPSGDTTLTIHLDNNLLVPVSIVIPGQVAAMTPVFFNDAQGRRRVSSFTHETPAGNVTAVDYTWTNLKAGTYLYLSGTHAAVQVQMGLYGAVTKDAVPAGVLPEAYPGVTYDAEVLLLYSEIDPALHAAVADGSYGTTGPTSTIDYQPKYFLINGEPYTASTPPESAGVVGDRVLLRFLNAGLRTHAPNLFGTYMSVISEDGNPYGHPRKQYSLVLPAGQTKDAIVIPAVDGSYPLVDRMGDVSNAGGSSLGGMVRLLQVAP